MPSSRGSSQVALVTGFDAYNGADVNPSGDIARTLDGQEIAGFQVVGRVLPVVSASARASIEAAIDETEPDAILMLGVWPGHVAFAVERVALNVLDFPFPDNDGAQLADAPVDDGGPAAIFSTAPVKRILEAWRAAGLPGAVSASAGTYLCNQSFYLALAHTASRGIPVAFVHIPTVPSEASRKQPPLPSLPLTTLVDGATVALEAFAVAVPTR